MRFKITSKIDSRTILGEQGSEQLWETCFTREIPPRLLVDDEEVEQNTEYLRSTRVPEYISAVTQQLEEDDSNLENSVRDGTSDEALYENVLQIIHTKRKVSIKYTQGCLRIGYNKAAIIVEKMEQVAR
jgi:S-DNA-T family DNA segregation ATPase FtsK/SpoIIIE